MKRLAAEYSKRGVDWCGIFPDQKLTRSQLGEWVKEYQVDFAVALDPGLVQTQRARATVTPEAAVFMDQKLVYRGRIDDRYSGYGKSRPEPSQRDVQEAIEAVLAGKAPAFRSTRSWGCFIELHPNR